MKASRFSDAQKAFILKQGADGVPVADICRKSGISQATYSIHPPITTTLVAPDRLASNCASERSAKRACATAIGGFTSCCGVRGGGTVRTKRGAFIVS